MALIKMGAVVTDISGKLGGHVFARNTGGNYMRTKTSPINPNTSNQSEVRGIFASISSAWSSLTDDQRATWRGAVDQFKKSNVFGDMRAPTGKALFQRLNQNLLICGAAMLNEAPAPQEVVFLDNVVFDNDTVGGGIKVSTADLPNADYVEVYATPPMTAGTKFVKNKLRLLKVQAAPTANEIDFQVEYEARFGVIPAGANVYGGVKTVNAVGQASPMQTRKMEFA